MKSTRLLVPGGGPMARLPRLIGSGRPLETLPSDNDLNGALAQRYGSVDRALVAAADLLPLSDAALGPASAHRPRLDRRTLLPPRHRARSLRVGESR
jgi:enoyl-CoA hydratase/carnithine racemase